MFSMDLDEAKKKFAYVIVDNENGRFLPIEDMEFAKEIVTALNSIGNVTYEYGERYVIEEGTEKFPE